MSDMMHYADIIENQKQRISDLERQLAAKDAEIERLKAGLKRLVRLTGADEPWIAELLK